MAVDLCGWGREKNERSGREAWGTRDAGTATEGHRWPGSPKAPAAKAAVRRLSHWRGVQRSWALFT